MHLISLFDFIVKAGHVKKFFILSNHFKNSLVEILSFENRGSRQQQQQNNREVVTRPYGCAGLSMPLFANTQQFIGKFLPSMYAFFGSTIFHHFRNGQ